MGFADPYLRRQKGIKPHIGDFPSDKLRFSVVIPVFCEPELHLTLDSIWNCTRPSTDAEVILVVNAPENADEEVKEINTATIAQTQVWVNQHNDPNLRFFIINRQDLAVKDAGAGFARKIGMDEAVLRFEQIGNPNGFILSLDADSCCDRNYFTAVENAILEDPGMQGFDIYFEHPVEGIGFPEAVYKSIVEYELHLRYVNQFMRFTGFPFAHHAVGSCFGVRADIYAAQGGMNKRKGGEDFYFLHKIIPLGNFKDICTTRVIPSPRESFRVPFGTGPAITKRIAEGKEMETYAPECFLMLRNFFSFVPGFFRLPREVIIKKIETLPLPLGNFLAERNLVAVLEEINANTATVESFVNRFFRWFDAFRMVKFLNYASREGYPKVKVTEGAYDLLKLFGVDSYTSDPLEQLIIFRRIEQST